MPKLIPSEFLEFPPCDCGKPSTGWILGYDQEKIERTCRDCLYSKVKEGLTGKTGFEPFRSCEHCSNVRSGGALVAKSGSMIGIVCRRCGARLLKKANASRAKSKAAHKRTKFSPDRARILCEVTLSDVEAKIATEVLLRRGYKEVPRYPRVKVDSFTIKRYKRTGKIKLQWYEDCQPESEEDLGPELSEYLELQAGAG